MLPTIFQRQLIALRVFSTVVSTRAKATLTNELHRRVTSTRLHNRKNSWLCWYFDTSTHSITRTPTPKHLVINTSSTVGTSTRHQHGAQINPIKSTHHSKKINFAPEGQSGWWSDVVQGGVCDKLEWVGSNQKKHSEIVW